MSTRNICAIVVVVALVATSGYFLYAHREKTGTHVAAYKTPEEASDVYVRFDMEGYDLIMQNYWTAVTDAQLSNLYQLSLEKALTLATSTSAAAPNPTLPTPDRVGTAQMLEAAFKAEPTTADKQALATNTLDVVLYNLTPAGRDNLLSAAQEVALRQDVSNIDPSTDLYADLGLAKGATAQQVASAYQKTETELKNATSSTAKAQLAQASYADQVLTNTQQKATYDQSQVQPSVFSHVLGKTLYLYFDKVSPTTLQEFGDAIIAASTTPALNSMILDFRGNIGGDLAFTQAFIGLFIGNDQYAFDLYSRGSYDPQRTTEPKFDLLDRYTDIAVLADNDTKSTAELTIAALKRFNLVHIVGVTTQGWGTVENTYPLTTVIDPATEYALLLVNNITLGADEQPIQGAGVAPDVNITDPAWKSKLPAYFTSPSLIQALRQEANSPPLQ